MFERMGFSGRWRDYQQSILDEFDAHFEDGRLHVVAAPGSGKTVLGLEIVRRIGRPALVLAPTRTIRDQWLSRLVPLFLRKRPDSSEVSRDLESPRSLTVVTYQALHSLWTDPGSTRRGKLIDDLTAIGPITLVVDEAHHLRREWWSALQDLVESLPDSRLVALTATPPYDAPFAEWQRYEGLCGAIDLEIGVPELVRNGDLCPHQDHIVFSAPDEEALALLDRRRKGVAALLGELRADEQLLDWFRAHPWLTQSFDLAEEILEAPELLGAILGLLRSAGRPLPDMPLRLLGATQEEMPILDARWLETLLNGILFRFPRLFPLAKERKQEVGARLHELGFVEGGRVRISESQRLFKLMSGNLAKLDSVVEIARSEATSLGAGLRMVVLSDHVRAGELPRSGRDDYRPTKLGVVPIFDALHRSAIPDQNVAVLTGSLVILPRMIWDEVIRHADEMGIDRGMIACSDIAACPDHVLLSCASGTERVVELVTRLFQEGEITVLIGTQALLGEGWDAPAINSLVLASNTAAFMLSNQMRGRAIRIDPKEPEKVSNIWHLATVDDVRLGLLDTLDEAFGWGHLASDVEIGSDLGVLQRRFQAFEGITNSASTVIENGISRLGLQDQGGLRSINARTFACAQDRAGIVSRWQASLGSADARAHVREIASPTYAPRQLAMYDTLRRLVMVALGSGVFAIISSVFHQLTEGAALVGAIGLAFSGGATLAMVPGLAKAGWLAFRNGSPERSLQQVGEALLAGLQRAGLVSDEECARSEVVVKRALSGRIDVLLLGATRPFERVFMRALAELLGPVQNPRYLLVRRTRIGPWSRTDYHAVPEVLGRQKDIATFFQKTWTDRVGPSELVYVRTQLGRIALLRARARSFAAGFQRAVDRRSGWT